MPPHPKSPHPELVRKCPHASALESIPFSSSPRYSESGSSPSPPKISREARTKENQRIVVSAHERDSVRQRGYARGIHQNPFTDEAEVEDEDDDEGGKSGMGAEKSAVAASSETPARYPPLASSTLHEQFYRAVDALSRELRVAGDLSSVVNQTGKDSPEAMISQMNRQGEHALRVGDLLGEIRECGGKYVRALRSDVQLGLGVVSEGQRG